MAVSSHISLGASKGLIIIHSNSTAGGGNSFVGGDIGDSRPMHLLSCDGPILGEDEAAAAQALASMAQGGHARRGFALGKEGGKGGPVENAAGGLADVGDGTAQSLRSR